MPADNEAGTRHLCEHPDQQCIPIPAAASNAIRRLFVQTKRFEPKQEWYCSWSCTAAGGHTGVMAEQRLPQLWKHLFLLCNCSLSRKLRQVCPGFTCMFLYLTVPGQGDYSTKLNPLEYLGHANLVLNKN